LNESPKAKLFREGRTILTSFGVPAKQQGSLIGMWLKSRNDPAGRRFLHAPWRNRSGAIGGPSARGALGL
jgi:hypothetical protein